MHIIVVGCGRLGAELSISLDKAGHSVSVIDKERRGFQRYLPERWAGRAVLGLGFDREVLEHAGIKEAGALAAVTGGDNSNILAARIARETYDVEHVVARIQDPRRAVIYQRLGIPTVAAVAWATDQVMRKLLPDLRPSEWTDATGKVSLLEQVLPASWAGHKLAGIDEADRFRLIAVTRANVVHLATPDLVGQEGDVLHLLAQRDAVEELDARVHSPVPSQGGH
ncbi:MAG: TrkA family potassium uptake protein [Actinobacteria bacterium]|nr:TrkA family potassium uptake protein [Actinomycetota bacterium]